MQTFEKLKQNYEFRRLYSRGISMVTPAFVLYAAKGRKDRVRFGITVSKKIGTAVNRNRAKRVLYAAFYECQNDVVKGYDFVAVARHKALLLKSTDIAYMMKNELQKAGLISDEKPD